MSRLLKVIGPGLLFASTAIGTSHLVLSTRAGAHHGMVFFWIILVTMFLKYPFYEFGPRYANATGYSLLKGYKEQGNWAIVLFLMVVGVNMFAVTGAVGAVSAGLLSTMLGMAGIPMPFLLGGILILTAMLLILGGYSALDNFIKIVSVVLLVTVVTAFFAVLYKGPVEPAADFKSTTILEGAGLALMISLIGFLPAGMEASTMHSIWAVEKTRTTGYQPTLRESLFDFNLGYLFTTILALMFLTIGAFTVYGSGHLLEGNATQFSNQLLQVFVSNVGEWSYLILALAAFGTIYGTLVTAWDAFARSFVRALRTLKFAEVEDNSEQRTYLTRNYRMWLLIIGVGAFLLFYFSAASMIQILEGATILAFLTAPIVGYLNLQAIRHPDLPSTHVPPSWLIRLSFVGLFCMISFALYFLYDLFS